MKNFIYKEFKKAEKYSFHIIEKLTEPENNISGKNIVLEKNILLKNIEKKVWIKQLILWLIQKFIFIKFW